jgi:hypothetical protein
LSFGKRMLSISFWALTSVESQNLILWWPFRFSLLCGNLRLSVDPAPVYQHFDRSPFIDGFAIDAISIDDFLVADPRRFYDPH